MLKKMVKILTIVIVCCLVISMVVDLVISGDFSMFNIFVHIWILLILMIPCIIVYWVAKLSHKMHIRDKLSKHDYKNEQYYREILKKYTPGELSYIDDFKIGAKDVVATLLALEIKGYIDINENIKVLKNDNDNLSRNEKYILDSLVNNKDINLQKYKNRVIEDCYEKKLLESKSIEIKNLISGGIKVFLSYVSIVIILIVIEYLYNELNFEFSIFIGGLALLFCMIYGVAKPISMIRYIRLHLECPIFRTKNAEKINIKIEGLKKYIIDFSNMEQRGKSEVILWEDYLVYAVFLGINTKIVEEINEKVKIINSIV